MTMNRCEDYPCCGHTDGLGCNYTPDYSNPHFLCDHETGECEVQNMLDEIEDEEDDEPQWGNPFEDDYGYHGSPMEDEWLDGSYEE